MAIKKIQLVGYAPDAAPDTEGILTDSYGVVPTTRGIGSGLGLSSQAGTCSVGPACGAETLMQLDGVSDRYVFGTPTKLYDMNYTAGTFTDVSAATYSAGTAAPWTFAEFGSVALAANINNTLQASTAPDVAFAKVSGAPKAAIVITCGEPNASFAMCFNYDSGTHYSDGIFWSAISDYTGWTPSLASQSGNIRLEDINGAFTAAIPFRDGVVAFKKQGMYLGTYVGGAAVWDWTRVSHDIGCYGPYSVCEAADVLYFLDGADLWMFDGSYPRRAPGAVGLFLAANPVNLPMRWDQATHRLWVPFYFSASHSYYLVFNTKSGLWTRYGGLTDGTNYIGYLFNANVGLSDTTVFNAYKTTAQSGFNGAQMTFNVFGAPYGMTQFGGLRAPNLTAGGPSSPSAKLDFSSTMAGVGSGSIAMTAGSNVERFDVLQVARYVRPQLTFPAGVQTFEYSHIYVDVESSGDE